MTRVFVVILAVVTALTLGWMIGIATSTRVNTGAAQAYAHALDIEARATYTLLAAEQDKNCMESRTALTRQLEAFQVACSHELTAAEHTADEAIALLDRRNEDQSISYSAQILGLREQLRVHGITPVRFTP